MGPLLFMHLAITDKFMLKKYCLMLCHVLMVLLLTLQVNVEGRACARCLHIMSLKAYTRLWGWNSTVNTLAFSGFSSKVSSVPVCSSSQLILRLQHKLLLIFSVESWNRINSLDLRKKIWPIWLPENWVWPKLWTLRDLWFKAWGWRNFFRLWTFSVLHYLS